MKKNISFFKKYFFKVKTKVSSLLLQLLTLDAYEFGLRVGIHRVVNRRKSFACKLDSQCLHLFPRMDAFSTLNCPIPTSACLGWGNWGLPLLPQLMLSFSPKTVHLVFLYLVLTCTSDVLEYMIPTSPCSSSCLNFLIWYYWPSVSSQSPLSSPNSFTV